ncbi:MAG: hypothetical protein KA286_04340 [Burkholderiales bacterium]|nr:hypothetical protein [Burkholderiales bacterium]
MRVTVRAAALAAACVVVAACVTSPIPITPSREVATAPVARVAVAPPAGTSTSAVAPSQKLDPSSFPAGAVYVCSSGTGVQRKVTAIAFDEKAGAMCRRHPEMGPCQYERDLCRKSGGRVYAADGAEITLATEAEYDRKVMRVRFKAN